MGKRFRIAITLAVVWAISTLLTANYAFGSGYAVFTQGATSLGQANAAVAHGDEPEVLFFNPALLNRLKGTQLEFGSTLVISSREFDSQTTGKSFSANTASFPSTLYLSHRFNDRVGAGIGVFNPFGLRNKWGEQWEGRYITTESSLTTFDINPAVSMKITKALSIGAGLDVLKLDATLEKHMRLTSLPDANQKFEGHGTGVGYNVGLLLHLTKDIAFGASYRSEIKVGVNGDVTFDLPPGTPAQIAALLQNAHASTSLTLPAQILAGLCYKGLGPLTLEAGMRWEGWSSFKELKIDLAGNLPPSVTKRDWNNVYSFNIGGKYQWNDRIAFLAGYMYANSPVPDETFDPTIPDADAQIFSLGTDISFGKFRLALSYAYQLLKKREKNNQVPSTANLAIDRANGLYKTSLNLVAVNVTYRF